VPELPEVEIVRRGLERHVVGRTIDSVQLLHPRALRRHLAGPDDFAAAVKGRQITGALRRGKYLWLPVGEDAVLAHLGMSGQLLVGDASRPLTPHVRVRLTFTDSGPDLRFSDQRTFGHLSLAPGGAVLPAAIAHIAPDPLEPAFDLAAVTGKVLLTRRADARRRGLDIRPGLSPSPTAGNPRLVERLVANLVDNALRYNIAGGWIEVTAGTRNGRAILVVANTGPVIPSAAVDGLFRPFQRLGTERTGHKEGGLGLGLSIVAAIADAHEATLTARSHPAGGLLIEASFPAPAARSDGRPQIAQAAPHRASGPLSEAPAPAPIHGTPQGSWH